MPTYGCEHQKQRKEDVPKGHKKNQRRRYAQGVRSETESELEKGRCAAFVNQIRQSLRSHLVEVAPEKRPIRRVKHFLYSNFAAKIPKFLELMNTDNLLKPVGRSTGLNLTEPSPTRRTSMSVGEYCPTENPQYHSATKIRNPKQVPAPGEDWPAQGLSKGTQTSAQLKLPKQNPT